MVDVAALKLGIFLMAESQTRFPFSNLEPFLSRRSSGEGGAESLEPARARRTHKKINLYA
jgi:hypothetical protein